MKEELIKIKKIPKVLGFWVEKIRQGWQMCNRCVQWNILVQRRILVHKVYTIKKAYFLWDCDQKTVAHSANFFHRDCKNWI